MLKRRIAGELIMPRKMLSIGSGILGHIQRTCLRASVFLASTCLGAHVGFSATSSSTAQPATSPPHGKASDLGPAMSLSWPLDAPFTCQALKSTLQDSAKDAAIKLQGFCNQASQQMEQNGYPRCLPNLCPVKSLTGSSVQDSGDLKARITFYPENSSIFVSLTYYFPEAERTGSSLICFDPMAAAYELVQNEVDTWDFKKFADVCVHYESPKSQEDSH